MKKLLVVLLVGACQLVLSQNITDVPICAQTCLSNATSAQNECTGIDVKCLCTNSDYVNALSCCLSTSCTPADQQKAISFNMATCMAVNESAPNFVGCSPGALISSASVVPSTGSSAGSSAGSSTGSSTGTTGSLLTTITGTVESGVPSFVNSVPVTETFNGRPLLTGTCSRPYFAQVTGSMGMTTQYPQVGCSSNHEGCCPFFSNQNAVIEQCPQDYTTTSGACCPSGWQIYFTELGGQTPCFTRPSITYVPASTSTGPAITVVTEIVFTRKYDLADSVLNRSQRLATGAIVGIVIGSLVGLAVISFLVFFFWRRRKAKKASHTVLGPLSDGEVVVASPASATHELASPHTVAHSPGSIGSAWISPSSPPAYENNLDPYRTKARPPAQELPGSTFIFEHHPAYTGQEDRSTTAPPSTPPRTPARTPPQSPRQSPHAISPHAITTSSPQIVSPLGSPKLR